MNSLPERIMEYARPEATPLQAKDLLHLADRAAVGWALSRRIRSDRLLQICRGVYLRHTHTRFSLRAPSLDQAIAARASFWGETIASNGGDTANWLRLTAQRHRLYVYLTSGPDPLPHFGAQRAKPLHSPRWQLTAAHGPPGTVMDAVLPKLLLASRSHSTQDSRTLSADAKKE